MSAAPAPGSPYAKTYQFSEDWLTTEDRLPAWNRYLKPLAARPIHYLEVGIYEGRSMLWMLENVLRHPESTATGVDILITQRYLDNLALSGACAKVRTLKGRSQEVLHVLPKESFDLIYIDGSHLARDVMVDAALAFELLKPGGILMFDDYQWFPGWPDELRPHSAIDAFITLYRPELKVLHREYQLFVQKQAHPCTGKSRATPVGGYCYHWVSGKLFRQSDAREEPLTAGEKEIVEAIARSAPFGETDPAPPAALRARGDFQALNRRLNLVADRR